MDETEKPPSLGDILGAALRGIHGGEQPPEPAQPTGNSGGTAGPITTDKRLAKLRRQVWGDRLPPRRRPGRGGDQRK
jgi:hypothetical protein